MNKKKIIILVFVVGVLIAVIGGITAVILNKKKTNDSSPSNTVQESQIKNVENFVGELNDGTKINTNAKFNTPSTLGDLSVDNIRLTLKNGITTFRATITNNGNSQTELKEVTLVLLNEDGEEIATAVGIINVIAPGNSEEFGASITSDYIHSSGYKIIEK